MQCSITGTDGGLHPLYACSARSASNIPHGSGVFSDNRVGGQQQNAFDGRLRGEHAVEGVLVDRRQVGDRDGVLAGDRSSS